MGSAATAATDRRKPRPRADADRADFARRRADLAWLLPTERDVSPGHARWDAQAVRCANAHGALFFDDLLAATRLLPAQLEDALRELAALGLVTSDGFAAVRATIVKHGRDGMAHRVARAEAAASAGGVRAQRPLVEIPAVRAAADQRRAGERWAWLLFNRYGVMFRDLLARESLAPSWRELVSVYRRLEMRGEIRGGRFVAGVAGEQFALAEAVEQLRQMREEPAEENLASHLGGRSAQSGRHRDARCACAGNAIKPCIVLEWPTDCRFRVAHDPLVGGSRRCYAATRHAVAARTRRVAPSRNCGRDVGICFIGGSNFAPQRRKHVTEAP